VREFYTLAGDRATVDPANAISVPPATASATPARDSNIEFSPAARHEGPVQLFNQEQAAGYDERFARVAPLRDALHLLIEILLGDLPDRARILCVGAGTGAELIALARAFPTFQFTAVEPSLPMLEVCQRRAGEEGIASRCTFHHGLLHTLPPGEPFDAATSLLVSQFLVHQPERVAFFQAISQRLRPRAYLISADLAANLTSEDSEGLKTFWHQMLLYTGTPADAAKNYLQAWKTHVAVLPPREVAKIIAASGFDEPTLFYQSLFIHAWSARRPD
jgi:tRNA (cmo5U34)-methyltransferase